MARRYVTYLSVTLNSEGSSPSEVTRRLTDIGWSPVYGAYDFKREWNGTDTNVVTDDVTNLINYIDEVHNVLRGLNVSYQVYTYEVGKEDFTVWNTPTHD